ncbi:MAG: hypothetical protein ACT4OT_12490 [Acidobacteriota bacterium]
MNDRRNYREIWRPLRHCLTALLTVLVSIAATGCSSSLYKVKSPAALTRMPATAATADVGSVSFRAAPLLTDEETQELFEANLQLAGLLPVRLGVTHNGGEPLLLKKLKFTLHDASGNEWKLVSGKQAVSRILKANAVFAYNPNSRKTFENEFRAYDFDLKAPLTHSERQRQGLIIFLSPQKEPVASPHGLTLSIEGLAQPVSLKLN